MLSFVALAGQMAHAADLDWWLMPAAAAAGAITARLVRSTATAARADAATIADRALPHDSPKSIPCDIPGPSLPVVIGPVALTGGTAAPQQA